MSRYLKTIYVHEAEVNAIESDLYDMFLQLKQKYVTLDWDPTWEEVKDDDLAEDVG